MLRLGVLVLLVNLCHATLHIPLVKHEKLLSANAYRESIERRHGGFKLGEMANLPLMSTFMQYYGKIAIGTPKQYLNVAFDTAITSIWVPSTDCHYRELPVRKNRFCKNHTLFDIEKSDSASFSKDEAKCDYRMTGEATCRDGTDIVCAGSLCAKQQSIQAATDVPKEYDQFYFDGVVGMGFVVNITDQKDLPWFYNVMLQDKLSYPVFTLYLNSKGPELIIGEVNYTLLTGDFIFAPVNTKTGNQWQFHAEMLEVRNSSAQAIASSCETGCDITLDSGIPYIVGPSDDIEGLQEFIGAVKQGNDYVIDCSKKTTAPMAVLRVLGAEVIMTGEDYIWEVEKGKCVTAFTAFAKPGVYDWIFGDVFLAAYYTMFDVNLKRVGFARAR